MYLKGSVWCCPDPVVGSWDTYRHNLELWGHTGDCTPHSSLYIQTADLDPENNSRILWEVLNGLNAGGELNLF